MTLLRSKWFSICCSRFIGFLSSYKAWRTRWRSNLKPVPDSPRSAEIEVGQAFLVRQLPVLQDGEEKGKPPVVQEQKDTQADRGPGILPPFWKQANELLIHRSIRVGITKSHEFPIQLSDIVATCLFEKEEENSFPQGGPYDQYRRWSGDHPNLCRVCSLGLVLVWRSRADRRASTPRRVSSPRSVKTCAGATAAFRHRGAFPPAASPHRTLFRAV